MKIRKLKSSITENAGAVFSEEDCWDLSVCLARVILPALQKFKSIKRYGYPASFVTGNEKSDVQAWEDTIDKMIWSFSELVNDEPNYPHRDISAEDVMVKKETEYGTCFICESNEERSKKIREYYARLQEGFELFGKYYNDLWD